MVANVAKIRIRILSLCLLHERVRMDAFLEQPYVDARPRDEEDVPLEGDWVGFDGFAASQQSTLLPRSVLEIANVLCCMNASDASPMADSQPSLRT